MPRVQVPLRPPRTRKPPGLGAFSLCGKPSPQISYRKLSFAQITSATALHRTMPLPAVATCEKRRCERSACYGTLLPKPRRRLCRHILTRQKNIPRSLHAQQRPGGFHIIYNSTHSWGNEESSWMVQQSVTGSPISILRSTCALKVLRCSSQRKFPGALRQGITTFKLRVKSEGEACFPNA